jgi:outer membrane immunogenic protein
MNKRLLLGLFALASFATPVLAADLPTKAPVYRAEAPYNWSGWYVGVNAGGDWGRSTTSTSVDQGGNVPLFIIPLPPAITALGAPASHGTSGFTGGVQGGYNWQSGNLVAGIEADFEYFRSAGSTTVIGPMPAGLPGNITITSAISTDWLLTVRPRLGFAANNWLFYGTGGLAMTQVKASWNSTVCCSSSENASVSATRAGWVAGAGVETALRDNWLVGVEYLHVDFGRVSFDGLDFVSGVGLLTNPVHHSADLSADIVRARVSKKF